MDSLEPIKQKIYEIRGQRIMLDFDLAAMYDVETRALNQAVKRNIERFPEDFMFKLTKGEWTILKSRIVTTNATEKQEDNGLTSQIVILKSGRGQHKKFMPYAFTEQGVAMLSSVLRSPLAIQVNIGIIRAFVEFRHMASTLALPNSSADIAQLRKDFEELKLDIEDILHDQNDINESTRMQLENITTAITTSTHLRGAVFLSSKDFSTFLWQFPLFLLSLQLHLPVAAVRYTEVCGAAGWSTTY